KVDYGFSEAKTTFGRIGVKVWVYHGDEIPAQEQETARARARAIAGMGARRAGGAASTGALITSPKDLVELEDEPSPVAEAEPDTDTETETETETETPTEPEEPAAEPEEPAAEPETPAAEPETPAPDAGAAEAPTPETATIDETKSESE
ncbi:MAG: hypothetical protein LC722_06385, partial [Actinobacteria bacterium]|nr:hypothetical protein [Actinomycetota bacterium]